MSTFYGTCSMQAQQEEGFLINNIRNQPAFPTQEGRVGGETAQQRADEWKDEGEKGLIAD